jgi:hypothetical protein
MTLIAGSAAKYMDMDAGGFVKHPGNYKAFCGDGFFAYRTAANGLIVGRVTIGAAVNLGYFIKRSFRTGIDNRFKVLAFAHYFIAEWAKAFCFVLVLSSFCAVCNISRTISFSPKHKVE